MCKHGTTVIIPKKILVLPLEKYANPLWIENFNGIQVDWCIAKEIMDLIKCGVRTLGCCCGHGDIHYGTCLIHKDSVKLVENLGYMAYKYRPYDDGFEDRYEIVLKTRVDIN